MIQWMTLLNKELLEMWRNYKWIWVPLTFILIGVQKPLSNYFMKDIIDTLGGLPKGTVIEIPTPTAGEVLIQSVGDYTSLGVLIIVLSTMGILAAERKSGVAAMILVKPVSYRSFVSAKWFGGLLLLWLSFFIGYLATWYYTGILFEWISAGDFFLSFFITSLWLSLILTITVFFSALLLSPGMVGFCSLAVVIVLSLISSTLSTRFEWSPSQLTSYANEVLLKEAIPDDLIPACIIAIIAIFILLGFSMFVFRKKELTA